MTWETAALEIEALAKDLRRLYPLDAEDEDLFASTVEGQ